MVRVCNLCLEIMAECDDEDEKQSTYSNHTAHLPASAGPMLHEDGSPYEQSPFAASQLFSRQHDNLDTISESRWAPDGDDDSRAGTSWDDNNSIDDDDRGRGQSRVASGQHPLFHAARASSRAPGDSAPFRRPITEEDTDTEPTDQLENPLSTSKTSEPTMDGLGSPPSHTAGTLKGEGRSQITSPALAQSSIAFPRSVNNNQHQQLSERSDQEGLGRGHIGSMTSMHNQGITSRLSSRVSTSGLSGVLLNEAFGGNAVWGSREAMR